MDTKRFDTFCMFHVVLREFFILFVCISRFGSDTAPLRYCDFIALLCRLQSAFLWNLALINVFLVPAETATSAVLRSYSERHAQFPNISHARHMVTFRYLEISNRLSFRCRFCFICSFASAIIDVVSIPVIISRPITNRTVFWVLSSKSAGRKDRSKL